MFSQASVILFTGGGVHGGGACMVGGEVHVRVGVHVRETCVGGVWQGGVRGRVRGGAGVCMAGGRRDSHCSGWYTSYWNAFLFIPKFRRNFFQCPIKSDSYFLRK